MGRVTRRKQVRTYWVEDVVAVCGHTRPIRAWHRWFFTKAAERKCNACSSRDVLDAYRFRVPAECPVSGPAARAYQPDPALIDWVVVQRLVAGDPVRSTRPERVAAVARMTADKIPQGEQARRMRVTTRTIERLRVQVRLDVEAREDRRCA